jgi:hypothetical protein
MKRKTITLISGNEDKYFWDITLHINKKEAIINEGYIAMHYHKQYYIKNGNKIRAQSVEWNKNNKERKANTGRKWYKENRAKTITQSSTWNKTNIEQRRRIASKYTKKNWRKCEAKRRRLGFIPLNKHFEGACAHHVDMMHIVYIPDKIHRRHSHNLKTGRGMAEINGIAFRWLFSYNGN